MDSWLRKCHAVVVTGFNSGKSFIFLKKGAATPFPEFTTSLQGGGTPIRNHVQVNLSTGAVGFRVKTNAGDVAYTEDFGDFWRLYGH